MLTAMHSNIDPTVRSILVPAPDRVYRRDTMTAQLRFAEPPDQGPEVFIRKKRDVLSCNVENHSQR
jgi:hypothetical protein